MTTQSGTLQQALGVSTVWLQASPNDTLTVTPAPTGTYSIEYPLGTIAVASATTTTTLAVDGGNAVIRLSSGAVTYSLVDKPDEAPIQSPVSGGGIAVTAADVLADTTPVNPGAWPAPTVHYISTAGAGVDVGTKVVWIQVDHATLPASRGWRFEFYPSATVV